MSENICCFFVAKGLVRKGWVPEGSLARIRWCHEIALGLVCGADFWCNRHCETSPVVLEGFWGQVLTENRPKTDPNISGQTAFRASQDLKAVWPELVGQVFGRCSAKLGPKTPLDRRGSSCSAGCTKNQHGTQF